MISLETTDLPVRRASRPAYALLATAWRDEAQATLGTHSHRQDQAMKKHIFMIPAAFTLGLAVLPGCRAGNHETSDSETAAPAERRATPGVVDLLTGKSAIEAGERAKTVIRDTSQDRQRQIEEILE